MIDLFRKMRDEKKFLNRTESMWLRKIIIKKYIATFGLEEIHYLELDDAIEKNLGFRGLTRNLISDLS